MEENKRKFNIIDLSIVFIALLVAAAIIAKLVYPDLFRTKPEELMLEIKLMTDSETSPYAKAVKVGDKVFVNTDELLGTVSDVKTTYAENGEPDKIEYVFDVDCSLAFENGAYKTASGMPITIGDTLKLNTKDTYFKAFADSIITVVTQED